MTLAFVFAVVCGVFVLAILVLALWTVVNGLRDEAKFQKQNTGRQKMKPAPPDQDEKPE